MNVIFDSLNSGTILAHTSIYRSQYGFTAIRFKKILIFKGFFMKHVFYKSTILFPIFLLTGCGNSSHTNVDRPLIHKAYYIDSAVKGITYQCGSQKNQTDKNGMFLFEEDKGCIFSIGNINFKTINADILTEGVIIKEDNISIAKFLLSFDWDGNATNGIEIKSDIGTLLDENGIIHFPLSSAQYTMMENALHRNYPSSKSHVYSDMDVQYHLEGNHPPLLSASVSPTNVKINEIIHFDATKSSDPERDTLTYQWFENNQLLSTQAAFDTSFFTLGEHTVTLTVTDTAGHTQKRSFIITVVTPINKKPIADAGDDVTVRYRQQFTVDASNSTDPDGEIKKYIWTFDDHVLYSGNNSTYTRKATQPTGYYIMNITVTDDSNATDTDRVTVHVTPAHNSAIGLEQTDIGDDEIITDSNTGLMWVNDNRNDKNTPYARSENKGCLILQDENNFIQKAKDFCRNLSYAGYEDWRVSTPQEISNFIKYWDDPSKPGTITQNLRDAGMIEGYTHKHCQRMIGIQNDSAKTVYTENTSRPGDTNDTIKLPVGMRCVRDIQ